MPFGPINEIKFLDILGPSHNLLLLFASGFPARGRDQLLESQAVTFDKLGMDQPSVLLMNAT